MSQTFPSKIFLSQKNLGYVGYDLNVKNEREQIYHLFQTISKETMVYPAIGENLLFLSKKSFIP